MKYKCNIKSIYKLKLICYTKYNKLRKDLKRKKRMVKEYENNIKRKF
nr:MAG TPA: hypothetical protein [Caudoviricetes sp.]